MHFARIAPVEMLMYSIREIRLIRGNFGGLMGLTEYKKKRDFKVTAEPSGKPLPKLVKGASRFVIQKHDASRLHYDFRLEMDGVLKSWAVPKGLPWEKGEKHLAVE